MSSLTIKLFDKAYVGFIPRDTESGAPIGYLTEYTDNAAGAKRTATIDRWVSSSQSKLKPVIFDNEPVSGFRIADSSREGGWRRRDTTMISIEDPRGFELSVSVDNVVQIMSENTVINGEIMVPCTWGRDGSENVLLPITSQPYKDAVKNTERNNLSVNLKTVKPGYRVELKDGRKGIYYGSFYALEKSVESEFEKNESPFWDRRKPVKHFEHITVGVVSDKKTYIVAITNNGKEDHDPVLDKSRSVKVARILESNEITLAEAEQYINGIVNKTARSSYDKLYGYIAGNECELKLSIEDTTPDALRDMMPPNTWHSLSYGFEKDGKFYVGQSRGLLLNQSAMRHSSRHNGFGYVAAHETRIVGVEVDKGAFLTGKYTVTRKNYHEWEDDPMLGKFEEADIETWYLPRLEITSTKTGEKFKTNI